MADAVEDLIQILDLEQIEVNLFRGHSPDVSWQRVFGGQVIGQALVAAYRTVEDRVCHSLHAYFIRPGDPKIPILYEVDRSRDGKSFTTRRVVAIQHGKQIFNLAASFQVPEKGFEHQAQMPDVPAPEDLPSERELRKAVEDRLPEHIAKHFSRPRPIEIRPVNPQDYIDPAPMEPLNHVWFRARKEIGDDIALNQCILAYASDMTLLDTCIRPHGVSWVSGKLQSASLDHAMWFHQPFRADEWVLYTQDSPSASGGRGFNRGSIYTRDGRLVASVVQEGLIRYHG
ncbi:MAG: acyl-CoA thioesterase II [Parvibaculum sp.]|jgi:acyl-CoA thioesterase-2|uniref:acyl-CoA thioesterase II n=1 Tax=Parvibaculum sp. TaxID=2024848 RepID=UPI00284A95BF|nr:acyl-CoA thioesterase II [Parvibaculum sp.]MDR3499930.1 acyl-CoA thioesterase II [Parvibaculum sp.]